ncbi:MAG: hypothetical protein NXI24_02930 [bacterium]|nr:hypothetical protein [bacterium]
MLPGLKDLDLAAAPNPARCDAIRARCAELSDLIQPYLESEHRLLSREWVELQVDQELGRLARAPGPPPPTATETDPQNPL